MNLHQSLSVHQPMIVKYAQVLRNGIQSHNLTRHGIGYVVRGTKYIYYGDIRHEIKKGDIFYLGTGNHYTEDVPETGKNFEQIVFYYTPDQLTKILNHLSMDYQLNITNNHSCASCQSQSHVTYPAWGVVKNFFSTINQYLKDDLFSQDDTAETIKMTELIYLILSQNDCCIKSKILNNMDLMKENFEHIIQEHIFSSISVEELAQKCHRSLTSFKKEFRKHYYEPPHKWFNLQRLMHSRLLLISTNKSISEIGAECNFPNTSHFIKLFKKEYNLTPASYRNHRSDEIPIKTTQINSQSIPVAM